MPLHWSIALQIDGEGKIRLMQYYDSQLPQVSDCSFNRKFVFGKRKVRYLRYVLTLRYQTKKLNSQSYMVLESQPQSIIFIGTLPWVIVI